MPRVWFCIALVLLAACGGGSGGDGGDDPPPPPPDPVTTARSTGLALDTGFADIARIGNVVLVPVSEQQAGADLNGDTDQTDRVLTRLDTATDATQNLALACAGPVIASDRRFAFTVSELAQGADLNGDGDQLDAVWHTHDPATGITTNLTIAASVFAGGAGTTGGFVLSRDEASEGVDLNGDTDLLDVVLVPFDGIAGALRPAIAGALDPTRPILARNGRVLFTRSEAGTGADLNGDTDMLDTIIGAVDFTPGLPTFLDFGRSVAALPYVLTDSAAAYLIDEATSAGDINLDGDQTDAVLAVFNFSLGLGERTPFSALASGFSVAILAQNGIAAGRDHIIVSVTEAGQFNQDINLDGDTFDAVIGWVDTNNAHGVLQISRIAIANVPPSIDGVRGLFCVSEINEGIFQGTDLNGDGDDQDAVLHRLDTTTGQITNLRFAVDDIAVRGDDAIVAVVEASNGTGPLNEDGDTNDSVLRFIRLDSTASRNLAIVSVDFTFVRAAQGDLRLAAILPEGQSNAFQDLNEDGDTNDRALVLFEVNSDGGVPIVVAPTPEVSDTAADDLLPPITVNPDVFLIPTSEQGAGEDRNGDTDQTDVVLTEVTVTG